MEREKIMKRIIGTVLIPAVLLSALTGCSPAGQETEPSEEEVTELGPARAQDDFFRYINQERIENAEFEYGYSTAAKAFDPELVNDRLDEIIRDVASGSGYAPGSEEDIIKRAYDSYLDYDFDNSGIPSDLADIIDQIGNASTVTDLMDVDAVLVRDYGTPSLLNITPSVNPFEAQQTVMAIAPVSGVLSVSFTDIRDGSAYFDTVKSNGQVIIMTLGYDADTSEAYATDLAYLALDLYGATDMDVLDDPMNYDYLSIVPSETIDEALSNIDLQRYLGTIGYDTSLVTEYCVSDMSQIEALNDIFSDENINALKILELGNLYASYSRFIAPSCPELAGYLTRDYSSLEDQALSEIRSVFDHETDPIYVERYYTPEADAELRSMCDDIREGYRDIITNAAWLSDVTRDELLRKLDNIVYVTGIDLTRHDASEYRDVTGSDYYELYTSYVRHMAGEEIGSFGEEISRTDVNATMQTFNAFYQPSMNNITITVAIMTSPFFDVDADYYTNLGGLGMVIAHEMGHAFDSENILFDSNGVYDPSWIPEEDMETLETRNEQAISYFEDNFTVFGVYHVDGEQTLGENYADLGAMECITSLTDDRDDLMLLFTNYATIWCEKSTDDMIMDQLAYDVHSPSVIRVNAILSTLDSFYETYDVTEGDGMYVAPENRISRWY